MAETDPVRIVVEIVDQFSDELAELRSKLEELDFKNLDIDLDIDDEGDIESVKAQLQALREHLETELDIDVDGFAQAMAKKQALRGDINSELNLSTDSLMSAEQISSVRDETKRTLRDAAPEWIPDDAFDRMGPRGEMDDFFEPNAAQDFTESIQEAQEAARKIETDEDNLFGDDFGKFAGGEGFRNLFGDGDRDLDMPDDFDADIPGIDARRKDRMNLGRQMRITARNADNLGKTLLKYRPSIMDWWNVMALLIPVMITLVGAVIGLTAALVALGAAAATIVGVGLLGWGDSMSNSLQNLQTEARKLGKTLFGVLQPAAAAFQPLQEDAMEAVPSLVADMVAPMQDLVVFSDELASIGTGFVEWMEEGMKAAIALDDAIGDILIRFGGALGDFLIGVLQTMVAEVHKNQNAYGNLGAILVDLVVTIFNLVKVVAFAVSQFRFLFDAVAFLSTMLSSKWAVALITTIGLLVALETALMTTAQALLAIQALGLRAWIVSLFPALQTLTSYIVAATIALWEMYGAWAAIAAATGIGLLLAGAGLAISQSAANTTSAPAGGRPGAGQVQSGGNTYIEVQGNVEKQQMDRLLDKVPDETQTELTMQEGMGG